MISKLTKEEVQEVIQLGTMLNPNFSKLFHIENLNPNETIYIYKENNINKGFIHIQNGLDIIDLLNIIVKPEYQNQGIGSVLLKYIIDNKQDKKIMLEVRSKNINAIKLYQKYDFKIINIRKNYYKDDDAIIMERN
ncbi:MAG: ribosomal protein S18-alanine N-acetyltransferase [Bacilli bacterium]|nr:ribosomal protein S18-alanine N-acetyltransferase [Bacilli bacterium]MCI6932790.1 ribosomal protein S18-alanine N-acetyltransferase [Mycoplasmatota bacterium]